MPETPEAPFAFVAPVHAACWRRLHTDAVRAEAAVAARLAEAPVPDPGPPPFTTPRPLTPLKVHHAMGEAPFQIEWPQTPGPSAFALPACARVGADGSATLVTGAEAPLPNLVLFVPPPPDPRAPARAAAWAAWVAARDAWVADGHARQEATAAQAAWQKRAGLVQAGKAAVRAAGDPDLYKEVLEAEAAARLEDRIERNVTVRDRWCKCCAALPLESWAETFCSDECETHYEERQYRGKWPATQCIGCHLYFIAPPEPQFRALRVGSPECAAMLDIDLDDLAHLTADDWRRIRHDLSVPRPAHLPKDRPKQIERLMAEGPWALLSPTGPTSLPAGAPTPAALPAAPVPLSHDEAAEAVVLGVVRAEPGIAEADLLVRSGIDHHKARDAIKRLLARGALRQVGRGVRGDPRRYWVTGA